MPSFPGFAPEKRHISTIDLKPSYGYVPYKSNTHRSELSGMIAVFDSFLPVQFASSELATLKAVQYSGERCWIKNAVRPPITSIPFLKEEHQASAKVSSRAAYKTLRPRRRGTGTHEVKREIIVKLSTRRINYEPPKHHCLCTGPDHELAHSSPVFRF